MDGSVLVFLKCMDSSVLPTPGFQCNLPPLDFNSRWIPSYYAIKALKCSIWNRMSHIKVTRKPPLHCWISWQAFNKGNLLQPSLVSTRESENSWPGLGLLCLLKPKEAHMSGSWNPETLISQWVISIILCAWTVKVEGALDNCHKVCVKRRWTA